MDLQKSYLTITGKRFVSLSTVWPTTEKFITEGLQAGLKTARGLHERF